MLGNTVVQPVRGAATDDQEFLEQTSDPASNLWRTIFGNEDRSDGTQASDPQTSNDTTGIDDANTVLSARLYGSTDQKDGREDHERVAPSELLVQKGCNDGAEEATGRE